MENSVTAICLIIVLVCSPSICLAFNAAPDIVWSKSEGLMHRKIKDETFHKTRDFNTRDLSEMSLEDYHTVDPVPSRSTTRAGPIEHSAPLIPWIISWPPPSTSPVPHHSNPSP